LNREAPDDVVRRKPPVSLDVIEFFSVLVAKHAFVRGHL
jgi:hypothetical protein